MTKRRWIHRSPVLAMLGVLLAGTPASASTLLYHSGNASVRIAGQAAVDVVRCVEDLLDGVVTGVFCSRVELTGDRLVLRDVALYVFAACNCGPPLFSGSHLVVEASGGDAGRIVRCLVDGTEPGIPGDPDVNPCRGLPSGGNILALQNTAVWAYG